MTFEALLQSKGIRWQPGTKAGRYKLCCVFCMESKYRLGVDLAKRVFGCFNCPKRGTLYQLLRYLGSNVPIDNSYAEAGDKKPTDLPPGFELLTGLEPGEWGMGAVVAYAARRGMTPEQIERWKIGACVRGIARNRMVMPVFEGKTLYNWSARAVVNVEPKYLMAKGGVRALWGTYKSTVVIFEGILKAMAFERHVEEYGALAALGNVLTEIQVQQLEDHMVQDVIIYPDPLSSASLDGLVSAGQLLTNAGIACWYPENFPDKQADEYETVGDLLAPLDKLVQFNTSRLLGLQMQKVNLCVFS